MDNSNLLIEMVLWHFLLCLASCCLVAFGEFNIDINRNSSLCEDVVSVVHNISDHAVQITLQSTRSCTHPTFIVRMSGSALYMLELQQPQSDSVFTYKYPCMLDSGEYFLEVVVIYCTQFNPNNFTGICMERPFNDANVVTLPYSVKLNAEKDCAARARWKLGTDTSGQSYPPTQLFTRHQRMLSELSTSEACDTGTVEGFCNPEKHDLEEYSRYQWVNATDWRPLIRTVLAQAVEPHNPVIHICYIGDSHTYQLRNAGNRIHGGKDHMKHTYIVTPLPSMFNPKIFQHYRCSVAIISFGQWMFVNGKRAIATSSGRYELEMRHFFNRSSITRDYGPTKVFFRTENYNGLGARYVSSPAKDYRSIPAIDMLNEAMRTLSTELDFDLIDLMHIQAPHWDGAPDFNHPAHNVFDAQLEWILQYVFADIIARGTKLVKYPVGDENYQYPIKDPETYHHQLLAAQHALELPPSNITN